MTTRKKVYDAENPDIVQEVSLEDLRERMLALAIQNGTGRGNYDPLPDAQKMYEWVKGQGSSPEVV